MEQVPRPQDAPNPQRSLKRCPRCGKEPPADLLLCPDDGAALVEPGVVTEPQESAGVWEAAVQRDILIGTQVGEYVLRRQIGAGGMGIVYEAEQPQIGRKVAVKILRPDVRKAQPAGLAGEARASGRIRHRAIVDVFGYGEIPAIGQYIVMEYLEGRPLDVLLAERGALSAPEALWFLDEVLAGLCAAHAEGVIHRDLKPSNLFVVSASGGSQYVKILDFGLAKTQRRDPKAPTTSHGLVMGTPEYMAPEQVQAREVSHRTDLYSLGVIAFEMLTGQRPFGGETPLQIAVAQVQQVPPRPSEVGPVPLELDALVLHLLEKDPTLRPVDAAAVRREVKELSQQLGSVTKIGKRPAPLGAPAVERVEPGRAPEPARPEPRRTPAVAAPPAAPARRSRAWLLPLALTVVGLVGGAAWALLSPSPSSTPAPVVQVIPEPIARPPAPEPVLAPELPPAPPPVSAPIPAPAPRPARRIQLAPTRMAIPATAEPTREALLKRIDELKRRVQASTPPGGSPNPMMLTLLGRQDAAARAATDGPARAKVARSLDAFEQQFGQSGDLKPR